MVSTIRHKSSAIMNNEYDMRDKFLISAQLIRVCLLAPGRPQIILLGCSVFLLQRTMERKGIIYEMLCVAQ